MNHVANERKIRFVLGGALGRKFGRFWDLYCRTPAEGMRLIAMNRPDFKAEMQRLAREGVDFLVKLDDRGVTDAEEMKLGIMDKVLVMPVPQGAKSGGIFQVIMGAVLIVASFYFPPLGVAMGMSTATAASAATAMMAVGFSMAASGIVSMLSPMPRLGDITKSSESMRSYYFNGAANSESQGTALAVVFGRMRVGGQTISAAVEAS